MQYSLCQDGKPGFGLSLASIRKSLPSEDRVLLKTPETQHYETAEMLDCIRTECMQFAGENLSPSIQLQRLTTIVVTVSNSLKNLHVPIRHTVPSGQHSKDAVHLVTMDSIYMMFHCLPITYREIGQS